MARASARMRRAIGLKPMLLLRTISGIALAHVVNSLGGMNGVDSHLKWFVTGSGSLNVSESLALFDFLKRSAVRPNR